MFRYFTLLACFCFFSKVTTEDPPESFARVNYWMKVFDLNKDGFLDRNEFYNMCNEYIFINNDTSQRYPLQQPQLDEIFGIFDQNANGYIDFPEFYACYWNWVHTIRHPRSAFIVIDVQNDFISGALKLNPFPAKHNGEDVVRPINRLLNTVNFTKVYYSLDWHPWNHVSFIKNVNMRTVDPSSKVSAANAKVFDTVVFQGPPMMTQRLWPEHCLNGTWGARLHKDLKVVTGSSYIKKGTDPNIDSYSVFWDNNKASETELHSLLKKEGITDVYIAGLAYDVCVGASALDAQNLGYRTILIDDCSRGVDPAGIEATRKSVRENHGVIVESKEVKAMVEGTDRRPELGYKLALEIKKNKLNAMRIRLSL